MGGGVEEGGGRTIGQRGVSNVSLGKGSILDYNHHHHHHYYYYYYYYYYYFNPLPE